MWIVALEEHLVVPELLTAWSQIPESQRDPVSGFGDDPLAQRLRDVGTGAWPRWTARAWMCRCCR